MMFTVMMIDIPLPIPRSVTWSPSHIRKTVPVVTINTVCKTNPIPPSGTKIPAFSANWERNGLVFTLTSDCATM